MVSPADLEECLFLFYESNNTLHLTSRNVSGGGSRHESEKCVLYFFVSYVLFIANNLLIHKELELIHQEYKKPKK